jgi:hypothetical protein
MPTATYIALANLTLSSTDADITFSSIPATYRDLVIVVEGLTSSSTSNFRMQFNSDTGSNYSVAVMAGTGSGSGVSQAETFTAMQPTFYAQWTTTERANNVMNIMDYSATDKHKTMLVRNNRAGGATEAIAGRWANTSAITSIKLFTSTGGASFASGTTFALYGIVS